MQGCSWNRSTASEPIICPPGAGAEGGGVGVGRRTDHVILTLSDCMP